MALTAAQKVTVAEICQETYDTIDALAEDLIPEQETVIIADILTWNLIRNSHVKLAPGAGGAVDFNNERKREAIRQRTRKVFGFDLVSEEVQPSSGYLINRFVF